MRDNICYLLEQGVATFLFGDHSEFNTLCYKVVSELREVYPQIRRIHYRTDYPDADAYTMQFLLDGYEDSICPDGVAAAGKSAYVERKLWKLLIDKGMKKSQLREAVGASKSTFAKLGQHENVTLPVLLNICEYLECDFGDIMEAVPENEV